MCKTEMLLVNALYLQHLGDDWMLDAIWNEFKHLRQFTLLARLNVHTRCCKAGNRSRDNK